MVTFKMIQKPSGVFAFDGEIIGQTTKALKIAVGSGVIWLPKKAVSKDYNIAHWFGLSPQQMAVVEPVSRFYNGADGKSELPQEKTESVAHGVDIAALVAEELAKVRGIRNV